MTRSAPVARSSRTPSPGQSRRGAGAVPQIPGSTCGGNERTTQALATSDADTLRAVAQRWAETDELTGSDPDDLTDVLLQLAQLAHDANARGHALSCRLSL
jgi:hypothetical protein